MFSLVKIKPCEEHFDETYRLLKLRINSISHNNIPSYEEHKKFVSANPYRYWFLIEVEKLYIGTTYIKRDNSIGIYIDPKFNAFTREVLKELLRSFNPLSERKSIRNAKFIINVALDDEFLADTVKDIGGIEIQRTFVLS